MAAEELLRLAAAVGPLVTEAPPDTRTVGDLILPPGDRPGVVELRGRINRAVADAARFAREEAAPAVKAARSAAAYVAWVLDGEGDTDVRERDARWAALVKDLEDAGLRPRPPAEGERAE